MAVLQGVKCRKCGRSYEDLPYYEDQVGCPIHDAPPEAFGEKSLYEFTCWDPHCDGVGTNITCRKSETPDMGYHCPKCGKDLTLWKGRKQ
jgi:predicted RNA-binding Zn-ribbon protein involved in translation (DUF1610 family)